MLQGYNGHAIKHYNTLQIDPGAYTKNPANGQIKLQHLPQGCYESIQRALPMMWTLYYKITACVDKIL